MNDRDPIREARHAETGSDTYVVSRAVRDLGDLEIGSSVSIFLTHSPGDELVEVAFGFLPDTDGMPGPEGGGGITDHGALTGLGDDHHTHYYNASRHTAAVHDALGIDHGSLSGRGDDDHTQYHNDTRGDARYSQLGHNHTLADVTDSGALAALDTVGTTQIDNDAVTYAKIQNVSATDKLLGRQTAGSGDVEEITCTSAGRAILDDPDASAQRTTLGLGNAATKNTGTGAGDVATGDHAHAGLYLEASKSLSDIGDAATGRSNLGLGTIATYDNTDFLQVTNNLSDLGSATTAQDNLFGSGALVTRHQHPWFFDDFCAMQQYVWGVATGGSGFRALTDPATYSWIETDGADGFMRLGNQAGTASTDNVRVFIVNGHTSGSNVLASGRRHIFRCGLTTSTSIKCSFGVARTNVTTGSVRPSPSFAFVIDTASSANIRCQHDNGSASTSDQDSGQTVASINQVFRWFEIRGTGSSVQFYIDGSLVATQSTNLPTGNNKFLTPFFYLEGAGGTYRLLVADKYGLIPPGAEFDGSVV